MMKEKIWFTSLRCVDTLSTLRYGFHEGEIKLIQAMRMDNNFEKTDVQHYINYLEGIINKMASNSNMGFDSAPITIDFDVNDNVQIINGFLEGNIGTVTEIIH